MDDLGEFLKLVDFPHEDTLRVNKRQSMNDRSNQSNVAEAVGKKKNISDIVGIKILRPVISYQFVFERMSGLTYISLSKVFPKLVDGSQLEYFVTAAVITNTFTNKIDQKGSRYTIWKITDLNVNMDIHTIFLFEGAHEQFWKTSSHKVVLFFNPKQFKSNKFDKKETCLSLANPSNILVLGDSKDLGTCQSRTKIGSKCSSFVNLQKCELCVHHIKQHHKSYEKVCSSEKFRKGLRLQRNTDIDQLSELSADFIVPSIASKTKSSDMNHINYDKRKRDVSRFTKTLSAHDKIVALQKHALYVIGKGSIERTDPNGVKRKKSMVVKRDSSQIKTDHNKSQYKRSKLSAQNCLTDLQRVKEIMGSSSKHTNLVSNKCDEEEQKYFDKLEKREKMEDVMLNTFVLKCKAVVCRTCNYTYFSAANKCLQEKHITHIIDAEKKFFVCNNCGKRTVSLFRLPKYSCENCYSSNWRRTSMMKNNICHFQERLSVRGDEEKFL